MPIEEAKWITQEILRDINKGVIRFDLWCNYKDLALRIKENCPNTALGLCMYTVLYNRYFAMSVCFRDMGYKILRCESFSDELMLAFEDTYVLPYVNIEEYV